MCTATDRVVRVRVRVLVGNIVLCSWERQSTLTVLSPPKALNEYQQIKCWGGGGGELASLSRD